MNHSVLLAIFKRNFTSYFLNPTGYVFICVFVLLSSLAAFWPNEFFTSNLANLDQLNKYFPLIMLIFIPAITMSIWAEERRQGTDELLLTIPATDFDVVMGKYLAAVAIYATALLFSLVCNFTILSNLGEPDKGLFFSTYVGYFMVGLAMLSIGMVASFLTSNITVGFVLGAIFCAIPIGLDYVEVILTRDGAAAVRKFGIAEQLRDFTQGVCSLSSMAYFTSITAIMLYLSIVLIGRRHWVGGRDGQSLGPHYLARTLSLAAAAAGLLLLTQAWPGRLDVTAEGLSTLSGSTKK
ncbi:MAG: ABC transporter permease, partial [Planctomycetia bacterium]|nr:ABC transporter permease [Planctomycetia bacterium]